MDWQEAEWLSEHIRTDAGGLIEVEGIERLGSPGGLSYTEFFVRCRCKKTGLQFAVKSLEHWERLKRHALVRLCKLLYQLLQG